ncbi:hypothetical protein [Aurantivibrio infirmus]
MNFGQRFHIELLLVMLVVGVSSALFLDYSKVYFRAVSLVEPAFYALHLRVDMSSHYAFTGRWSDEVLLSESDVDQFERSVKTAVIDSDGDIKIILKSRYSDLDGKALSFVLNQYITEQGFVFHSWRCGGAENPSPYRKAHDSYNEIPQLITDPLCRRK